MQKICDEESPFIDGIGFQNVWQMIGWLKRFVVVLLKVQGDEIDCKRWTGAV